MLYIQGAERGREIYLREKGHPPEPEERPGEPIGAVFGTVGSLNFRCILRDPEIKEMDHVQVYHPTVGWVLGMVDSIELQSDLSQEGALVDLSGNDARATWRRVARISMIGRREENGSIFRPLTPVLPASKVYRADEDMLKRTLGLRLDRGEGVYVGKIFHTDVDVVLDPSELVKKHISIIAKTGSGKSYACGVLIEELSDKDIPVVVLDLHGEYHSLMSPNLDDDQYLRMRRFDITPEGLAERLSEFSFMPSDDDGEGPHPIGIDIKGFKAEELLQLMGIRNMGVGTSILYNALNTAREVLDDAYDLSDVLSIVENDHNPAKWNIVNGLQHLLSMPFFSSPRTPLSEIVQKGRISVIGLGDVPLDHQQIGVAALVRRLYIARREGAIPPFMLVVEEAHNFCPQTGPAVTKEIIKTIASEGRKFGLGLMVVTQRAAKVDKNVLSQCGTQIIMKVTNPNDIKAIISSVEGLDTRMSDEIQRLPVSIAIVVGGNVSNPILTEIRIRRTRHGGDEVDVLPHSDNY